VTFFAGTYHVTPAPVGGMIIDDATYAFTASSTMLPGDLTGCQETSCGSFLQPLFWQQVNVSGLGSGEHSFTTTCSGHGECPWPGCYPQSAEFRSCSDGDADGICDDDDMCPNDADNDADSDGVCGDVDVCADTVLVEGVPTVRLGQGRLADLDGDGVFDSTDGPTDLTLEDTGGCSCEQIIDALALGEGHVKFGCTLSTLSEWAALYSL
jgi:hypothetical protein